MLTFIFCMHINMQYELLNSSENLGEKTNGALAKNNVCQQNQQS